MYVTQSKTPIGKGILAAATGAILIHSGYKTTYFKLDSQPEKDEYNFTPNKKGGCFILSDGEAVSKDVGFFETFTGKQMSNLNYLTGGKIKEWNYKIIDLIEHIVDNSKKEMNDFCVVEIGNNVENEKIMIFYELIEKLETIFGKKKILVIKMENEFEQNLDAGKIEKLESNEKNNIDFIFNDGKTNINLLLKDDKFKDKNLDLESNMQSDVKYYSHSDYNYSDLKVNQEINFNEILIDKDDLANNLLKINKDCLKVSRNQCKNSDVIIPYFKNPLDFIVYLSKTNYVQLLMNKFEFADAIKINISSFEAVPKKTLIVSIIGKYFKYSEPYSLIKNALYYSAKKLEVSVEIHVLNKRLMGEKFEEYVFQSDVIVIPGGSGEDNNEGKIYAINYAKKNNIPILCICLGFQLALIEIFKKMGFKDATSAEFIEDSKTQIFIPIKNNFKTKPYDGTRTGRNEIGIKVGSLMHKIYTSTKITEVYTHSYFFNPIFYEKLKGIDVYFSGFSNNPLQIGEIFESNNNKFFVGVQFHPEMNARFDAPHPLFTALLASALINK